VPLGVTYLYNRIDRLTAGRRHPEGGGSRREIVLSSVILEKSHVVLGNEGKKINPKEKASPEREKVRARRPRSIQELRNSQPRKGIGRKPPAAMVSGELTQSRRGKKVQSPRKALCEGDRPSGPKSEQGKKEGGPILHKGGHRTL